MPNVSHVPQFKLDLTRADERPYRVVCTANVGGERCDWHSGNAESAASPGLWRAANRHLKEVEAKGAGA